MASLNLRIDSALKERDITPSDLVRQTFEGVVQTGKQPVSRPVLSGGDEALRQVVRERLASPQPPVTVTLDDL